MRVEGKVALVTGGSGGIGGGAARLLAKEGARVFVLDIAEAAGTRFAAEIGGEFMRLDVSQEAEWLAVRDAVIARTGKIDVLVNAAGIEGNLVEMSGLGTTLEEWRRVMAINLDGTFLGARSIMPHMLERGMGSIVNLASIVSIMATPSGLAYGASKAGVHQLTRSLAVIGARDGAHVRCNAVLPGVIKTRMTDNIIRELALQLNISEASSEEKINAAVPFKARGNPDDIANIILYLASDESSYVTGAEFKVDGGWSVISAG